MKTWRKPAPRHYHSLPCSICWRKKVKRERDQISFSIQCCLVAWIQSHTERNEKKQKTNSMFLFVPLKFHVHEESQWGQRIHMYFHCCWYNYIFIYWCIILIDVISFSARRLNYSPYGPIIAIWIYNTCMKYE